MREFLYTECYLLPQKLIFIPVYDNNYRHSYNDNQSNIEAAFGITLDENGNKIKHSRIDNVISANSKRKLWYALMTLKAISTPQKAYNYSTGKSFNFLLNFITLTLPALNFDYSDTWLKRNVLNNFWSNIRYKYDLKHFVSKYEAQENGNLHIHITTNTYIHYQDLNRIWNRCLSATNLISLYQNKWNKNNPNSTDIHSVTKLNSIYQEFLKYIQKQDKERRKIDGRLWTCSKSLVFNNRLHFTLTDEFYNDFKYIENRFVDNSFKTDYFDCYTFKNEYLFRKLPKSFLNKYNEHLNTLKSM